MHAEKIFAPKKGLIRARTRDHQTFDSIQQRFDAHGNHLGKQLEHAYRTHDSATELHRNRTVDSTGAFLVGELERLDQTIHEPLVAVTWGRDVDLREDVTIADETSSFTTSSFASAGNLGTGNGIRTGKAWIGKTTDQIGGVGVDIAKTPLPLRPWALEVKFTILELESAAKLGRPIDQQKIDALQLKHQMDIDEQVYVGDATTGDTGLMNSSQVTNVSNAVNGAGGTSTWATKTPDEILADVNGILTSTWEASAWAQMPDSLLIPPTQFGYISTQKVSNAGNVSIMKYILENNLLTTSGKGKLRIAPVKWAVGAGVGGTLGTAGTVDRMVAYTKEKKRVRYPMTLLQRTPIQYDSIYHKTTYYCRLGVLEVVYGETIAYVDGI